MKDSIMICLALAFMLVVGRNTTLEKQNKDMQAQLVASKKLLTKAADTIKWHREKERKEKCSDPNDPCIPFIISR